MKYRFIALLLMSGFYSSASLAEDDKKAGDIPPPCERPDYKGVTPSESAAKGKAYQECLKNRSLMIRENAAKEKAERERNRAGGPHRGSGASDEEKKKERAEQQRQRRALEEAKKKERQEQLRQRREQEEAKKKERQEQLRQRREQEEAKKKERQELLRQRQEEEAAKKKAREENMGR